MYNEVRLIGKVSREAQLIYNKDGKEIYEIMVAVERTSKVIDNIRVATEDKETVNNLQIGDWIKVAGTFQCYRKYIDNRSRMILNVNAETLGKTDEEEYVNHIELEGVVCKPVITRTTPLGKTISDVMIAINRPDSRKSDYIPTIVWGSLCKKAAAKNVGDTIHIIGRIQERFYEKDGSTHNCWEVSAKSLVN